MTTPHPRVGVASIIVNVENKILLGKRKGSHGAGMSTTTQQCGLDRHTPWLTEAGTWQLPGGHLDFKEDPSTCAARETLEECDLEVKSIKIVGVTNDVFEKENKHYITLFIWCEMKDPQAEAKVRYHIDSCPWKKERDIRLYWHTRNTGSRRLTLDRLWNQTSAMAGIGNPGQNWRRWRGTHNAKTWCSSLSTS